MIDKDVMYTLPLPVTQTLYGLLAKISLQITSPSFKEDAEKLHEAKVELEKLLTYYQEQQKAE
jgi:hypothetical protein